MPAPTAWEFAFPKASAELMVKSLVEVFHLLANAPAEKYTFNRKEPELTSRLGNKLEKLNAKMGPIGHWDFEASANNETFTDLRRIDIRFSTIVGDKLKVLIIFECKKLRSSSLPVAKRDRAAYINEGIRRFKDNHYRPSDDYSFMVSFTEAAGSAPIDSLIESLSHKGNISGLGMQRYPSGRYCEVPSPHFDPYARFATCHIRLKHPDLSPTITLYHLHLPFP